MKKIALILVVLLALSSAVFAGGGQAAGGSGKVQITLLIRNMDEQFLKDYSDNVRKLAAEKGMLAPPVTIAKKTSFAASFFLSRIFW